MKLEVFSCFCFKPTNKTTKNYKTYLLHIYLYIYKYIYIPYLILYIRFFHPIFCGFCLFSIFFFWYFFSGYGFVDFESPAYAENAVKSLQAKGIKAQMAKVGVWVLLRPAIVRCFYSFFSFHLSCWLSFLRFLFFVFPLFFVVVFLLFHYYLLHAQN